jgi:nicotinate-nucleotide pyrophosphorylase (carboxylating)
MQNSKLIKQAISEDVGPGDITTQAIIPSSQKARAIILAKENGIIAGVDSAREVFRQIDKKTRFTAKVKDGARVKKGKIIVTLVGPARGILAGERVALNFLQRLSGIATLTRKFKTQISKVKTNVRLLDTRKTTPGLRVLEKYAVKMGGGENHRMGLYDAILIKDNHIKLAGGVENSIVVAKLALPRKPIEVEAKTISEVKEAIKLRVDRILLDNMNIKTLRDAVKLCKIAGIKTEASGGINLNNVGAVAKTGVDYISVGALTHSPKALDISLKVV